MKLLKNAKRGFTLVELMIVVAIVGVLAALAIGGVQRYMASAKGAEARNNMGRLVNGVLERWNDEVTPGGMVANGASVTSTRTLCASAAASVPAAVTSVAGSKYQAAASEWSAGARDTGWACLRFDISGPQYYQYSYTANITAGAAPAVNDFFTARAIGDLDADTVYSTFERLGQVRQDSSTQDLVLTLSPSLDETAADE